MVPLKDGKVVKRLEIIRPVLEADILINLPKFKTHNLTMITGAIKNIYGVIHGRSKTLYHTKFLEIEKFYELLFDLHSIIKPSISIMDGIIGLEGEGPGASGIPRQVGLILASRDSVALDMIVTNIMGIDPASFPLQQTARSRGISSADIGNIEIKGPGLEELKIEDYKKPRAGNLDRITSNKFINTYILPFMRNSLHPLPKPDPEKCNLCESCINVCPEQCISLNRSNIKIDYNKCIRCYCCAEMCPQGAILAKDSFITRLLSRFFTNK
jgi:ferredoxin